jgi:hypothetical protein
MGEAVRLAHRLCFSSLHRSDEKGVDQRSNFALVEGKHFDMLFDLDGLGPRIGHGFDRMSEDLHHRVVFRPRQIAVITIVLFDGGDRFAVARNCIGQRWRRDSSSRAAVAGRNSGKRRVNLRSFGRQGCIRPAKG